MKIPMGKILRRTKEIVPKTLSFSTNSSSLKLLVVQETDWLERGPHQQHHLFERLTLRGHEIVVVDFEILYTPWPRAPLVARKQTWSNVSRVLPNARVRVVRPGTLRLPGIARLLTLFTFYRALQELVLTFQPDVFVDYALSTGIPALRVARQHELPFLMHVIDSLHTLVPNRSVQPFARAVEKRLLHAADQTLFINHALQDYGIALGAREETASTIRTGVDLERFHPRNEPDRLREEYGFLPDDVVFTFIGWLYEFTGIDAIMQVLPELPAAVKLFIVGVGESEARLRRLATELGVEMRVVFTGRQPYETMPAFIAAADVCLLFSKINEVTRHIVPIKLYEYMASGKPVLASELPGVMRETPPGNGVTYARRDTLVPALKHLLSEETRRQDGEQARRFVETHCGWETLTDEFENLLKATASRR